MNLTFFLSRVQNTGIFKWTDPLTETVIKLLTFTRAGWYVCVPAEFICQSPNLYVMVLGDERFGR